MKSRKTVFVQVFSIIFDKVGNSEVGLLLAGAYKLKRFISMRRGRYFFEEIVFN